MKRRRAKKGWPVWQKIGCLLLALVPFVCCVFPFIPRGPYPEPPQIIGVRKGTHTNQLIIRETSYTITGPWPGPHGPSSTRTYHPRYYFNDGHGSQVELTFLRGERIGWYGGDCRPVNDSPLWVSAHQVHEPHVEYQVEILVFDTTQIVRRRKLPFSPDWNDGKHDYWFEEGNRRLFTRTNEGYQAYNVVMDTIAPCEPPKQ